MTQPLWRPVAGKYGRTRVGEKVGPMAFRDRGILAPIWNGGEGDCRAWQPTGQCYATATGVAFTENDLVSEWLDEPSFAEQWRKLGPHEPMKIVRDDPAPAQPIDIYEVVAGDLLELRVKVDRIENGRPVVYSAHAPGMARVADAWPQDIIRHIPMRQFIEEGCIVALDGGGRGKVLKIWEGMAWVIRLRNGQPEPCAPRTWPFDRLTRIDGEPA